VENIVDIKGKIHHVLQRTAFALVTFLEPRVSGLHNWIQIYLEEKKGKLDYRVSRTRWGACIQISSVQRNFVVRVCCEGHLRCL